MAVIENPILNVPFLEPTRHFKFHADGITDEILSGRRPSSHFVPIPRAKKKGKQLQFETEWTKDRIEPNPVVDRIRQRVGAWRQGGYVGVTGTTSRLLAYWTRDRRDKPLFFCQIEAAETAIYITEVARKYGDAWIENDLRTANDTSNPGLRRMALKMATGSGKTVVMAMLIAWQALNFPQLFLLIEFAHDAADRIYKAIVESAAGTPALKPILRPYDLIGSTRYVDFDTTKAVYPTAPDKCHISHVVADTGSWEQKMAQAFEEMPEVLRYVKNQSLGFTIPYTLNGEEKQYFPDFITQLDSGSVRLQPDLLNMIVEVTGEARKDKAAKVTTARTLWVPAVNNHGGFGRWAFIEVTDPWDAQRTIREAVQAAGVAAC
jgi:hypothetical protein